MPAKAILMVEPTRFRFNEETAKSNFFQNPEPVSINSRLQEKVMNEFYSLVDKLQNSGVVVSVKKHISHMDIPDAVFPNNWISFLPDGTVIIYPMLAENRRNEKELKMIQEVSAATGYEVKRTIDLSYFEAENKFLEGTGSIVFDHHKRIAFASLSPRTHVEVLEVLCSETGYEPFVFEATDRMNRPVYHTNVMLTITAKCAVICLESIRNKERRADLHNLFTTDRKAVIDISIDQMEAFAGNMLELENQSGDSVLVMSETAYQSLDDLQRAALARFHTLLFSGIPLIEKMGGGSARCMLAEVFI